MNHLFEAIDALTALKPAIIAIEGPCAGGKSTLAARLEAQYNDEQVYHMDDFFLQPAMRTAQRLSQPGGNVDYERFLREVLLPLRQGKPFEYFAYDCQSGEMRKMNGRRARLNIVEGSYCLHPELRQHYDLSVFLDVEPDEQVKRILLRNSERMAQRFFKEWIPLENAYFDALRIRDICDIRLETVI